MDMKLEVVPLPITEIEQSKAFYVEKAGFNLDHDVQPGNGMRIIQLTPPGSACSIVIGTGMGNTNDKPGSVKNLHLVVKDIAEARESLIKRGLEITDIQDMGGVKYAYFSDPDGNSWALQEISLTSKPS